VRPAAQGLRSLTGADPATHRAHELHHPNRAYPETNCYTDVVIELLHARGLEPLAMLGHLVRVDFEGDQWTFFKPPPADLETLYGVDIHEMQPYRPLPAQIAEQIARDRTLIVELDAFFLPDTAATSYRSEHVKTSVAADAIDPAGGVLRYFHNTGLHELNGEDYQAVFGLAPGSGPLLPPYVELVRFDTGRALHGQELRAAALELLRHHLRRRVPGNPFERFAEALVADLGDLLGGEIATYHAYAFATVRMAGAAFELAGSHLAWLFGERAASAVAATGEIVQSSKVLSFRLARRRPFDPSAALDQAAIAWETVMGELQELTA
jgi:hypothetical protein